MKDTNKISRSDNATALYLNRRNFYPTGIRAMAVATGALSAAEPRFNEDGKTAQIEGLARRPMRRWIRASWQNEPEHRLRTLLITTIFMNFPRTNRP